MCKNSCQSVSFAKDCTAFPFDLLHPDRGRPANEGDEPSEIVRAEQLDAGFEDNRDNKLDDGPPSVCLLSSVVSSQTIYFAGFWSPNKFAQGHFATVHYTC